MRVPRKALFALLAVTVLTLGGCSSNSGSSTGASPDSSGAATAVKVGLLLPENQTLRWEKFDKPVFENALKAGCPDCELLYANAQNDAAKQQTQAESMIAQGVNYLVLAPVDGAAAATIVKGAKAAQVPVIGYGRQPDGPLDYSVTFSDEQLGQINGDALKTALKASGKADGQLVFVNGDKTTPNTAGIRKGAIDALGGSPNTGKEYYIKNWDPAEAQKSMDQAITALGRDNIAGVYVMNDGMAGGVIAALKSAGVTAPFPPVTGMDAEVAAVQRILIGEQLISVYHSPPALATTAAGVVLELVAGKIPKTTGTVTNGTGNAVPLVLPPPPIGITVDNIQKELIDTGVYQVADICTADYADACKKAGLH